MTEQIAEVTAESAPAEVPDPKHIPLGERLKTATQEEYRQWEKTGKLPSEAKTARTEGESEPPKPEKKELSPEERSRRDKENNERRWTKLNRELGEARAKIRELETRQPQKVESRQPVERVADPKRPAKPDPAKFTDQAAYDAAYDDWIEAVADYKAELKIQAKEQAELQRKAKAEQESFQQDFKKRFDEYADSHDDFQENFEKVSPKADEQPHISDAISRSDVMGPLIDYLAEHEDEFDKILGMSPTRAVAALGRIEAKLTSSPQPKKHTDAPPPGKTVSGRSTAVEDPIEAAAKAKNWALWEKLKNEKDLRRMGLLK